MDHTMSLEKILEDIRSKTGVNAYLTPRGEREYRFCVEWGGNKTDVYLRGEGESAEREAKLVAYLLSQTPARAGGRQEQLKSILLGEEGEMQAFRYMTKYSLPEQSCFAVDVLPEKRIGDALEHIRRCLDGADAAVLMDESRIAVVKFVEEGQTPYEFAQFLNQSLYEEAGIRSRVGIGCEAQSFGEIALSYNQAVSATRMSSMFRDKGEVHSYREYFLMRMLGDLPRERLKDYLGQFRASGAEEIYADEELFSTAEVFLESNLNLSESSRALYIHRNTLSYRLDKIERLTGLNIRKFSDAVTFRVIMILLRLVKS